MVTRKDSMTASTSTTRSGLDLRWVDRDVRPQDDLYAHVNGLWLRTAEIPPDRAHDGALRALVDKAEIDVRDILEQLVETRPDSMSTDGGDGAQDDVDACRLGRLYASFLDVEAVENVGVAPLLALLEEITAAPDRAALAEVLGRRQREGLAGLFWVWIATDAQDSTRYLVHLTQAGLGLPDESYYGQDDYADTRQCYQEHLARLAHLAGLPDPSGLAESVFELETELAAASWDQVSNRDHEKTYTLMTWAELSEIAPGFEWTSWLAGLGAADTSADPSAEADTPTGVGRVDELVVRQPSFLAKAARLWRERPLQQWKAWLAMQLISACAPYLSRDLVEADFEFRGRALSGTPVQAERWKRGVSLVETAMGDAVGRLYVARHFSAAAKQRALTMVEHLIAAYRASITELDWMGHETRRRALTKLDQFTAKIGCPDRWKDYSTLEIRADDLLGNVRRAGQWRTGSELAKIGQPVDREEWFMTPQTVNAYYNPRLNEIVFPAAVLQPPLFDPEAEDAANYGGIGATIGHEIGHGFDDQGAKYDGEGNLNDWWEPTDRARFDELAQALVDQYDALCPAGLPGHTVNGALTVGENIGDLGGLAIAVQAYRLALANSGVGEPPVIDGLTGLQRVFFSWAQSWRAVTRETEALRRLAIDPHAPPDLRCNAVVTHLDAFYEAFDVSETDALFTPESDRVRIW
jgi:putative endopeptidase